MLLMGFAGASRRCELVALTVADVQLHRTDGVHVRLRSSKTVQQAHGQVKALPYGRDPVTCPPCAFVRWREVLQAWDTADPNRRRQAVMTVLRHRPSPRVVGEKRTRSRSTRLADPVDPGACCSRRCTPPA